MADVTFGTRIGADIFDKSEQYLKRLRAEEDILELTDWEERRLRRKLFIKSDEQYRNPQLMARALIGARYRKMLTGAVERGDVKTWVRRTRGGYIKGEPQWDEETVYEGLNDVGRSLVDMQKRIDHLRASFFLQGSAPSEFGAVDEMLNQIADGVNRTADNTESRKSPYGVN